MCATDPNLSKKKKKYYKILAKTKTTKDLSY